jgi:isochorismate hydrolase
MAEGNSEKVAPNIKRLCRLIPQRCALLVCDMQEKFRPAILHFEDIVKNTSRIGGLINKRLVLRDVFLVESCKLLGVPILVTEQYPKGLGPTVDEIGIKVS